MPLASDIIASVLKAAGEEGVELARQIPEPVFISREPSRLGGGLHPEPQKLLKRSLSLCLV